MGLLKFGMEIQALMGYFYFYFRDTNKQHWRNLELDASDPHEMSFCA